MPAKTKYPNIPEDFRELIRQTRLIKGLPYRVVGEDLGVPGATISQFERGDRNINYEWAKRLKTYYGLDCDLPEPDLAKVEPITRRRENRAAIKASGLFLEVDGELIEVVTYRKLGPLTKSRRAHI